MIEELERRALVSEKEDRAAWLDARVLGVTATMIKKLMMGGAGTLSTMVRESLTSREEDLSHIPRIAWGRQREEVIADWVSVQWGIRASSVLFHALDQKRYLATPDGIGVDWEENLLNSEIKTSAHDLDPEKPGGYFWETGYYYQVQWALMVTGATKCLFVWEQHDDDWSGWPERGPKPVDERPRFSWIVRDDQLISEMIDRANEYLAALDEARDADPTEEDVQLVGLTAELFAARRAEAEAAARKEAVWKRIVERHKDRPSSSKSVGLATVTWTAPKTIEQRVPDPAAAAAAHPLVFRNVGRAAALWEHIVSKYTKVAPKTVPGRMTVTEAKEAKK